MSDDGMNLSRRKVLGGITTVGAASAAAGAGTFALFSDSGQTSKQTISTGTVKLNDDNPFVGNLNNENLGSSGKIGSSSDPAYVRFEYEGNLEANLYLGMTISDPEGTVTDSNPKTATELAEQINLDLAQVLINPNGPDSQDWLGSDEGTVSTVSVGDQVLNELPDDANKTLAGLNSALPTATDSNDNTVPALKYATVTDGDKVELQVKGQLDDVGDDFQDEALNIQVFGMVEEA
jgi:predicted ribosomally synthesized peptide with SipW-like signal peptide